MKDFPKKGRTMFNLREQSSSTEKGNKEGSEGTRADRKGRET